MVRRSSLLILFTDDPQTGAWGRGSRLAFRTAVYNLTPAFVVSAHRPPDSLLYRIIPGTLFGVVDGFWTVPHQIYEGGPCDED